MPKELTEEEQAEQDRLEAEEKVKTDEEAKKAAEANDQKDRGDDFTPVDDEENELDAEALAKIAAEEEDPEAKKKAEEAAAAKKKEEDDAAAKKAAEEKEPDGIDEIDKKIKIPKWRLDQSEEKRRETERENEELKTRIAALEKGSPPEQPKPEDKKEAPKVYNFEDAEERYADALVEGDKKKAAEIRSEIRAEEEKYRQAKQDEQNTATATRQAIENEAGVIATKMFKEYPFFDSTSDKANKRAIGVLLAVRDQAFRAGTPFPQAVQQAFDEVGPMYVHLMEKPVEKKGEEKKTSEQIEADKKKLADDEKKKAALAAGAQPPDLKGSSQQASKKINAATLTDEEFDALPEAEKARLRGDNA